MVLTWQALLSVAGTYAVVAAASLFWPLMQTSEHALVLGVVGVVVALGFFDLNVSFDRHLVYLARLLRAIWLRWIAIVGVILTMAFVADWTPRLPRDLVFLLLFVTPLTVLAGHLAADTAAAALMRRRPRRAVMVGNTEQGRRLARALAEAGGPNFHMLGHFEDRTREPWVGEGALPRLGSLADLPDFVRNHRVDAVYFAIVRATEPSFREVLDELQDTTCSVYYAPDLLTFNLTHMRVDEVDGVPIIAVCDAPARGYSLLMKRIFDFFGATLLLIAFSPVMVLSALAVALTSRGPILFKQHRYGLDGEEIMVWKFRTMYVCENGGQVRQATWDDPRVTPVGRFLRRASFDELPQLFNVLLGTMSLVGPRPHAVAHNEYYRRLIRGYMLRHKTKPGITGLAQVRGLRGETETLEKMAARVEADLEYLRNWSIGLDLMILLRTVSIVLGRHNAY